MAVPLLSLLLLLILTLLSPHVLARSARMFSKITSENVDEDTHVLVQQYPLSHTQEQEHPRFTQAKAENSYSQNGGDNKHQALDETDQNSYSNWVDSLPTTYNSEAYVTPKHSRTAGGNEFMGTTVNGVHGADYFEYYKGQQLQRQGNKNTRFYVSSNGDNNGVEFERDLPYGMSDTRFMENGKYYYNLNNQVQPHYQRGDMNIP